MTKIISWNVNGLRACLKKGFADYVAAEQPDILCLQEIKAFPDQVPYSFPEEYTVIWHPARKPGYSGTLLATKLPVLQQRLGLGIEKHDQEGRVIAVEHPDFWMVTVYTPNSKNELQRLPYRSEEWDVDFLAYLKELEKSKPVVFCGDLNVAHQEIDLARPNDNHFSAGFTDEERRGFDNIVGAGFIDTFRALHPEARDEYSWWSYRAGARKRNVGWRIDYVCLSPSLAPGLREAFIRQEIEGSDHCPVGVCLEACP
ncbi:MAG: exodeoxyribonuclease III [Kiritimatiellia bacterium]